MASSPDTCTGCRNRSNPPCSSAWRTFGQDAATVLSIVSTACGGAKKGDRSRTCFGDLRKKGLSTRPDLGGGPPNMGTSIGRRPRENGVQGGQGEVKGKSPKGPLKGGALPGDKDTLGVFWVGESWIQAWAGIGVMPSFWGPFWGTKGRGGQGGWKTPPFGRIPAHFLGTGDNGELARGGKPSRGRGESKRPKSGGHPGRKMCRRRNRGTPFLDLWPISGAQRGGGH